MGCFVFRDRYSATGRVPLESRQLRLPVVLRGLPVVLRSEPIEDRDPAIAVSREVAEGKVLRGSNGARKVSETEWKLLDTEARVIGSVAVAQEPAPW